MKHVGHTMATPELSADRAIDLFSELGLDASELICMTSEEQGDRHGPAVGDAPIPSYQWDDRDIDALKNHAQSSAWDVDTSWSMRTTIRIRDDLLQRAKARAADEGRSLSSLIEEGLSILLASSPPSRKQHIELPVSKASGGVLPGVDLNRSAHCFPEDAPVCRELIDTDPPNP